MSLGINLRMKKKITILIVNFNSSQFIELSLYALEKLTKNKFDVFIVDNGSAMNDYRNLKNIIEKHDNINLERFETDLRGSMAHGTALNYLVKKVKTPFFSILDADAAWLKNGWDEILINKIDKKIKVIGTQAPKGKPQDFPLMFAILFETEVFKRLNVDFRPKNINDKQDTGFEIREKYLEKGFAGENIKFYNTRDFNQGPFSTLTTAEFYLDGHNHIFASHFGRGATLGRAKYKKGFLRLLYALPFLGRFLLENKGRKERDEWVRICYDIINKQ